MYFCGICLFQFYLYKGILWNIASLCNLLILLLCTRPVYFSENSWTQVDSACRYPLELGLLHAEEAT